jgi:hypothetical protein
MGLLRGHDEADNLEELQGRSRNASERGRDTPPSSISNGNSPRITRIKRIEKLA